MDQFPITPYYITTDINGDPAKSDTVCRCVENDIFADLPADSKDQNELPRTFVCAGIFAGMEGKGATRIDTILANTVGAHACRGIHYLYEVGKAFDHCPVLARAEAEAFSDTTFSVAKAISINIPDPPKGKDNQAKVIANRRRVYLQLWNKHYSHDF